ncbi:preprotein translocase subunit TatB [Intrasporangium oryzae NRRL B-24470]|uniref:Preprotein translocase subunit TatB n=1 Tax=Intrasporangium oryzae NRRL B-24470 TaxID=1386089 RepID=W9G394_9MICO|nr:sulfurtransferase TusA family protein [Intrasporangium oryzae]EWT00566.1 preprotein translocase subunit TatB [Intrasporangium oryzae NRRL B-24470]
MSDAAARVAVVDARGLRCPLPVIRLAQLVRDDPAAGRVTVLATDPAAAHDIPAWCRLRGHRYLGARDEGAHTAYDVEVVRPTAPATAP